MPGTLHLKADGLQIIFRNHRLLIGNFFLKTPHLALGHFVDNRKGLLGRHAKHQGQFFRGGIMVLASVGIQYQKTTHCSPVV